MRHCRCPSLNDEHSPILSYSQEHQSVVLLIGAWRFTDPGLIVEAYIAPGPAFETVVMVELELNRVPSPTFPEISSEDRNLESRSSILNQYRFGPSPSRVWTRILWMTLSIWSLPKAHNHSRNVRTSNNLERKHNLNTTQETIWERRPSRREDSTSSPCPSRLTHSPAMMSSVNFR